MLIINIRVIVQEFQLKRGPGNKEEEEDMQRWLSRSYQASLSLPLTDRLIVVKISLLIYTDFLLFLCSDLPPDSVNIPLDSLLVISVNLLVTGNELDGSDKCPRYN